MNGTTGTTGTTTGTTGSPDPGPAARRVIVVGSGPTGLLLAGDLATAGVPVTVLEKRPHGISNLSRAFALHARTLEQLDGRGLADELEAAGRPLDRLRLFGRLTIDLDALPSASTTSSSSRSTRSRRSWSGGPSKRGWSSATRPR